MRNDDIDLKKIDKQELGRLLCGLRQVQGRVEACIANCLTLLHMVTVFENREFHPIRNVEEAITDPWKGLDDEDRHLFVRILQEAYRLNFDLQEECSEETRP